MSEVANVNWIAIIVGAILSFGLGALWYSPKMFLDKWAAGSKVDLSGEPEGVFGVMSVQFLGTFLMAWAIGIAASHYYLGHAIIIILAIAVLIFAGGGYSQKSTAAKSIEGGFVVAMGVIMILCQAFLKGFA